MSIFGTSSISTLFSTNASSYIGFAKPYNNNHYLGSYYYRCCNC